MTTRRRTGRSARSHGRSASSAPPPASPFIITSVSQTAGAAAGHAGGGSLVTVTTNGLSGTPTSTLGTVVNIVGATFQIQTAAHAPGGVSWTATNGNGQVSAPQVFTYLAPPTVSGFAPTNGPATIAHAASYVITGTGFPPAGSGVAVSGTVGVGALTGFSLVNATTLDATNLAAPGTGSLTVAVTVDGVASTGGAALYTGNPPPSVTGVTSVGTSGGSATCNGTNFVATPTASVNINGTPTSLSVTWISSTEIVELLLVGGPYAAGDWDLTITNPDGQSVTAPGIFEITSESNPQTIFGANLKGQWIASQAVVSGSNVVSVPDNSGNSNSLTVVSATPPVQVMNDTRFGQAPTTIQMSAANSTYLACPSFAIGGSGACFLIGAVDYLGSGSQEALFAFCPTTIVAVYVSAGNELGAYYVGFAYVTSPLMTAGPAMFVGGNNPAAGAQASLNAGTVTTGGSASANTTTPAPIVVGAQYTSSSYNDFSSFVWPELLAVNVVPTSTQILALAQYMNDKYGVTQAPSFASSSPVPASTSGAALRISGGNFQPGISVMLLVSGSPVSMTVVSNSTTVIDCTTTSLAAGTYDLILTNTDGRGSTFTGAVTVQSSTANAAVAAMNIFGLSVVGLYTGPNVTLNGSNVSAWLDMSGMGNHWLQSTSTYQPTYHTGASDSTFNDQPYVSANGTSQFLECAAFALDGATGHVGYCTVITSGATGATRAVTNYYGGAEPSLQFAATGYPEIYAAGYTSWGQTITGAQNVDALTGTSVSSINVANSGTPVTTAGNNSVSTGYPMYAFVSGGSAQFGNNAAAAIVVVNATPNSTQLGLWHSFCQSFFGTT